MAIIQSICDFLESYAPTRLAEDWDNVGLLVGDSSAKAAKVMTCLTITPESAQEAIDDGVNLIVSHHPLPFRPMKRLTTSETGSRILWDLIRAGVSIYSPHTGFDSAAKGINQSLAERLGLTKVEPLKPAENDPDGLGSGRCGHLSSGSKVSDLVANIKKEFGLSGMHIVGDLDRTVEKVGVACGSGGSFLEAAIRQNCDTFVTGETNFHTCLEACARQCTLILLGHYASERFAVETLAADIGAEFSDVKVWASQKESDPLKWV